jgi:hypothetical protein
MTDATCVRERATSSRLARAMPHVLLARESALLLKHASTRKCSGIIVPAPSRTRFPVPFDEVRQLRYLRRVLLREDLTAEQAIVQSGHAIQEAAYLYFPDRWRERKIRRCREQLRFKAVRRT